MKNYKEKYDGLVKKIQLYVDMQNLAAKETVTQSNNEDVDSNDILSAITIEHPVQFGVHFHDFLNGLNGTLNVSDTYKYFALLEFLQTTFMRDDLGHRSFNAFLQAVETNMPEGVSQNSIIDSDELVFLEMYRNIKSAELLENQRIKAILNHFYIGTMVDAKRCSRLQWLLALELYNLSNDTDLPEFQQLVVLKTLSVYTGRLADPFSLNNVHLQTLLYEKSKMHDRILDESASTMLCTDFSSVSRSIPPMANSRDKVSLFKRFNEEDYAVSLDSDYDKSAARLLNALYAAISRLNINDEERKNRIEIFQSNILKLERHTRLLKAQASAFQGLSLENNSSVEHKNYLNELRSSIGTYAIFITLMVVKLRNEAISAFGEDQPANGNRKVFGILGMLIGVMLTTLVVAALIIKAPASVTLFVGLCIGIGTVGLIAGSIGAYGFFTSGTVKAKGRNEAEKVIGFCSEQSTKAIEMIDPSRYVM